MARYHAQAPAPSAGTIITDTLESVARTGAQRMLQRALEDEVQVFLGRDRYAPGGRDTGYRNGHGRAREIGIGTWSVPVRAPRVSDIPPDAPPFESANQPRAINPPIRRARYLAESLGGAAAHGRATVVLAGRGSWVRRGLGWLVAHPVGDPLWTAARLAGPRGAIPSS